MSLITLHYGQCGNQIGEALYTNIYNDIHNSSNKDCDYYIESLNKWFQVTKQNKWEPRSVLVDTENKTAPQTKNGPYCFKNVITKSCGGSANNWSFGYYEQSKLLTHETMECVRKELEKSDLKSSFLNIFSSSGGTGAGVGASIIESLKNEFPNNFIVNAIVLPFMSGELVVQSYNTLLTLSKIYSLSDAIILFENDRIHYSCVNSLSIKDVSFSDINNLLVRQLISVYQPLKGPQTSDIFKKLCGDSSLKLLQIRSAPLSKLDSPYNWKSLLSSLSKQSRFDFQQKKQYSVHMKPKLLSTALVCRGVYNPVEKDLQPFKDSNFCNLVEIYHQKRKIFNLENYLTVISNGNNVYTPLNVILKDAQNLYKYGAYVHHYTKFGETHFENSFKTMDDILTNYKNL